jgi:hypothetical protein
MVRIRVAFKPYLLFILLLAGYVAGITGLGLDWLGHRWGTLPTPQTESVHIYAIGYGLGLLLTIIPPWLSAIPYLMAYLCFAIGITAFFIYPPAGNAVLLTVLWFAGWSHENTKEISDEVLNILVGSALLLIGSSTDWFWYEYWQGVGAGADDLSISLLPGHYVQLIGWVLCLWGAVTLVRNSIGAHSPAVAAESIESRP